MYIIIIIATASGLSRLSDYFTLTQPMNIIITLTPPFKMCLAVSYQPLTIVHSGLLHLDTIATHHYYYYYSLLHLPLHRSFVQQLFDLA